MTDNPWDALSEKQRRRVTLRARGLSWGQIAQVEGVTRNAVRESVYRACEIISGLRDILSGAKPG